MRSLTVRGGALLLALVVSFVFVDESPGQIFRKARNGRGAGPCLNGVCLPSAPDPAPEIKVELSASEVAQGWYKKLTGAGGPIDPSEEAAVRSWSKRAVRIINGNACGTGSLCGRDDSGIYILTNAHVASSRVGNVVRCEAMKEDGSGTEKFSARVIEAAYSSRTMTDWALLKADPAFMVGIDPIKLSKEKPDGSRFAGTWGCPRCEIPSGQVVDTVKLGSLWYWQPNSIGGQSGSAVVQDGKQKGLLTWTIGGDGAGQTTAKIWEQSTEKNTDGPARSGSEIPVSWANGVELVEGYSAEAGIGDLPIWDGGSAGPGGPTPSDPCPDADSQERRLLDALRRFRGERGVEAWLVLIELFLKLLEIYLSR